MVKFIHASIQLWLLTISQIITDAQGSSERSKPIKKIAYVSDIQIDVQHSIRSPIALNPSSAIPSTPVKNDATKEGSTQLCSQDSFLLHFSLSAKHLSVPQGDSHHKSIGSKDRFTLFLKPSNKKLLHPSAKISYQSPNSMGANGLSALSQPLISDEVLAYSGFVAQTEHLSISNNSYSPIPNQNAQNIHSNNWSNIVVHHPYGAACVENDDNITFEGAFEFQQRIWHIKTLHHYQKSKSIDDFDTSTSDSGKPNMVAWTYAEDWVNMSQTIQFSQFTRTNSTNSYTTSLVEMSYSQPPTRANPDYHYLQKRQTMASDMAGNTPDNVNYGNTIGSTDGCPKTPKMVYIGIAADCTYLRKYGSIDSVRLSILNNMNIVSSLYQRTFNVSLGIIDILIPSQPTCPTQADKDTPWNTDCPTSSGGLELSERLDKFSEWRNKKGGSDGAGTWHLMTDCPNGSEVGISWLGSLCKADANDPDSSEKNSATGVTASSPNEWQTMAHEIGHVFGAVHDCTSECSPGDACCPASTSKCDGDKQYLMAPSSSDGSTNLFSPCSIGNICSSLKPGNQQAVDSSCVSDLGLHHITSLNQCGNGILEPGEDCDPGLNYSPCCQWGTCKFSSGAVCMPGANAPCCSSTCQFAPSATPCNSTSSAGQCSGNSPQCSAK